MAESDRDDEETPRIVSAVELAAEEPRLLDATRFAWQWHGPQTRKGKPTSYLGHLLQVQGFVIEHGGDAGQAIAALLHDALEDAESALERAERESLIDRHFGEDVLRIILDCTDTTPEEAGASKGPWQVRKDRYVEQLRNASRRSLLVAACDKRHNLGDLVADLRHDGTGIFARFNAGPDRQVWYFETLLDLFRPGVPPRLSNELAGLLDELRGFVEEGGESGDDGEGGGSGEERAEPAS